MSYFETNKYKSAYEKKCKTDDTTEYSTANKIVYEIVPKESFSVVRHCPGCGGKTHFINTKKFRINANGIRLDVWLIYQCENCRHTLNLAIYERQKAFVVPKKEYESFLSNDEGLAEAYGKNRNFFRKNKAEIDFERMSYDFILLQDTANDRGIQAQLEFTIQNPCELKIRPEKQIAEAFGFSRSQVQKQLQQGKIILENVSSKILCGTIQLS